MSVLEQNLESWIERIEEGVKIEMAVQGIDDASHDIGHLKRVSSLSRQFTKEESGNELIAYTAGMLHDIINLPKNHPESHKSSLLASLRAEKLLNDWSFPKELVGHVCHAVHAHSFSAKVEPKTIEAKCLQDADRMEALGAFGLMRVFYVSGKLGTQIMDEKDPAGKNRKIDDKKFALDHFVQKLFSLESTMKTKGGAKIACSLTLFLKNFRDQMIQDFQEGNRASERFMIAETYYNAGKNKLSLFHTEDPFAEKRRILNPFQYALDAFLEISGESIQSFKKQLKFELGGYSLENSIFEKNT